MITKSRVHENVEDITEVLNSKKMRDRFPDEYKAMEAEINKPRPKGESYNPEPKAQELSIQQEEDRTNQYTKRPRM